MEKKKQTKKTRKPSDPGRNSKRTPETKKALLDALMVGHTDRDACILSSVSHDFFYAWIKESDEFSDAVEKARLKGKDQSIKIIRRAGMKSWQAAAWYLERRWKNEYAPKQFHEHETPIPVSLTDEAAKRLGKYNPKHKK